jgi:hypothetical protein
VTAPVRATVYRQEGKDPKAITTRDENPFRVAARSGPASASATVRCDASKSARLTLRGR